MLSGGNSGNPTGRQMRDSAGSSSISYHLYLDSSHYMEWTDGSGYYHGSGTGSTDYLTVYGQVPSQSTPRSGLYHDTVTVTVNY